MAAAEALTNVHTTEPSQTRQGRKNPEIPCFEPGAYEASGSFLFVKQPSLHELARIHALAQREIPGVARFDVVKSVYSHNPISFWAFLRASDATRKSPELVGFCAYLPLNAYGVQALRGGNFGAGNPNLGLLAAKGETPAALYIWAIVAHGTADLGGQLIGHAIGLELFESLPICGTVGTESGRRALKKSQSSPQSDTAVVGSFFEARLPEAVRVQMRALEVHEGLRPNGRLGRPSLEVRLAATPDDIARVFALRAAVFLNEQDCPYEEEFDGNDYAGAHMLGLVGGEPAAVLRVRYFADFVKLERLAVLPRFRRTLIAKLVVEHAIEICRRKGYTKMYGHAQKRLVGLWERFGFVPMNKNMALVFSDHEYVEMLGAIAPHEAPLTPYSDPYMLIRPEGLWDAPGVLDRSARRDVSNPQRDRPAAGIT